MRRVPRSLGAPPATGAAALGARLRPWALPALTVCVALWLFAGDRGFDVGELREDFARGQPEAALARLAAARPADLPAPLAELRWYPQSERARALSDLALLPEANRLEDLDQPTIVAPLDRVVQQPAALLLREPRRTPLRFALTDVALNLAAAEIDVPPGTARVPLEVPLLQGNDYMMTLADPASGALLALARFSWLPDAEARRLAHAMTLAHDLAGASHEGSSLLAAITALQLGFPSEAIARLEPLESAPGYERLALELHALALARQGLDESALRLLQR